MAQSGKFHATILPCQQRVQVPDEDGALLITQHVDTSYRPSLAGHVRVRQPGGAEVWWRVRGSHNEE